MPFSNTKLKLLIVEDEDAWITQIQAILFQHFRDKVIVLEPVRFIPTAVEAIKIHKPDILLLDLKIGNRWGWDILKEFSAPDFLTIFITSYLEFYEKSILESSNFGFLDKNSLAEVPLREFINRALQFNKKIQIEKHILLQRILNNDDIFGLESITGDFFIVNRNEVIYASVNEKIVTYHTFIGEIRVSGSLENALDILNLKSQKNIDEGEYFRFFQIHRNTLVNLNFVRAVNKNTIIVDSLTISPISLPISRNARIKILSILK